MTDPRLLPPLLILALGTCAAGGSTMGILPPLLQSHWPEQDGGHLRPPGKLLSTMAEGTAAAAPPPSTTTTTT